MKNDKNLEVQLRQEDENYQSILDNFVDLYYQADGQGIITNLSRSCFVLSGWKPEELIGHPVTDLYAEPAQREVFMKKLFVSGVVYDYELTLLHKNGRHVPVSVSSHIVKDDKGVIIYVEGTIRDITERKKAEEELNKSKEDLKLKIAELEKVNSFMIDREIRIAELKKEVEGLRAEVVELKKEMAELKNGMKEFQNGQNK
ncbi:MAG: PAS domain S-box protein [Candidatus Falkowbacteria bacterium]